LPFELFIYNRWGNLVFEQVSNELPFTGKTKNGQDLQQGIYLFKLIYENGEKSGFIHLIR
jgi:hypothetical protein